MLTELLLTHFTKSSQFLFAETPFHIYETSNGDLSAVLRLYLGLIKAPREGRSH